MSCRKGHGELGRIAGRLPGCSGCRGGDFRLHDGQTFSGKKPPRGGHDDHEENQKGAYHAHSDDHEFESFGNHAASLLGVSLRRGPEGPDSAIRLASPRWGWRAPLFSEQKATCKPPDFKDCFQYATSGRGRAMCGLLTGSGSERMTKHPITQARRNDEFRRPNAVGTGWHVVKRT